MIGAVGTPLVYVEKYAAAALLTAGPSPPTGAQSASVRVWISADTWLAV